MPRHLITLRIYACLLSILSLTAASWSDQGDSERKISFNRDVRPILSDKCYHCHGPDAENQDSEFRLDTREHALEDLGGYAGIIAGDSEASELVARIRSQDEDVMPPADSVRQLDETQKQVLEAWIAQGAEFEGHWAFEPIQENLVIPGFRTGENAAENSSQWESWAQNPIDAFILDSMQKHGLTPNPIAEKTKWLRRVYFDLTGLPPTPSEIDAFVTDESPDAYAKVADRLFASTAHAERLTSEWLDVARYSDSYGFQRDDPRRVWPYRDWVINAFRANMPYDQFIREQLAGDLMENPSRDQILATTFNRLHSHKKEGGVAVEEFRVENVADRTHTFAGAFLGLTMECARCHDHKYDPTKTKEYYQLSSFFANIDENGLISYFTDSVPTPSMPLPTEEQEKLLAQAADQISRREQQLAQIRELAVGRYQLWKDTKSSKETVDELDGQIAHLRFEELKQATKEQAKDERDKQVEPEKMRTLVNHAQANAVAITPAENILLAVAELGNVPTALADRFGNVMKLTGDDAVVMPGVGRFERHEPFTLSLWMRPDEIKNRGVIVRRSRGWDDAGSVGYELTKLGRRLTARIVHFWPGNAIAIETKEILEADSWYHLVMTYDGSSRANGLRIYVNGVDSQAEITKDCLTRDISTWRNGYPDLAIGSRYRDRGLTNGLVDEFRAYSRELSPYEVQMLYSDVDSSAQVDQAAHQQHYIESIDEEVQAAKARLREARFAWNQIMDSVEGITIMRETPKQRDAFVLTRGVYDSHGEKVTANTPAFLPSFPPHQPRNRLGLAHWVTAPNHPLTARVTVNRYWQMIFGQGLVRTPEDFGIQGTVPTHPELLDWLARDFISNRWDLRRLIRMMVLSSTYQQSAIVTPQKRQLDLDNLWLARGPAKRLSAEMVRDNALAVSGLLNPTVGGPPVKPYDIALAYHPMEIDKGEKLYRRSLYTFWKRTSPAPVMMTLNASKREVCRVKREITASPLQALVLLNGPQFIESAKTLAAKLLDQHQEQYDALIDDAFYRLISRHPSKKETKILRGLLDEQLAEFTTIPEQAAELLKVGQAEVKSERDPIEIAATTVLVNSIMNLNESVRHQ